MDQMNVSITEHLAAYVRKKVKSGRYNNASEVVRDALRLLEDREKLRELRLAELKRLSEEGRVSGLSEDDGDAVLDRLEAKYRGMVQSAKS